MPSERRWIILAQDGRHVTMGRAAPPSEADVEAAAAALTAQGLAGWLATLDGNAVVAGFEKGELLRFELDGTMIELEKDDVLTAPMKKPGFVVATDRGVTVALDTNLTEELISEGFERELISKIQTMRKEAGFKVTDRIKVGYQASGKTLEALEKGGFLAVVLADSATPGLSGYIKEWDINGETATLSVEKVEK